MEDKVWYNAEVLEVCGPAIQVRLRDYGNIAEVDEQFILPRVEEIPEEDLLANLLDVNLVFKVGLKSFILLVMLNISVSMSRGWGGNRVCLYCSLVCRQCVVQCCRREGAA